MSPVTIAPFQRLPARPCRSIVMVVQTVRKHFRPTQLLVQFRRRALAIRKRITTTSRHRRAALIAVPLSLFLLLLFSARHSSLTALRHPTEPHQHFDTRQFSRARAAWRSQPPPLDPPDHWSRVKHDVVFVVKTGHEVAEKRLAQLRANGWWSARRHVPNIVAIGDEDNIPLGVVGIKNYAMDLVDVNATRPKNWFQRTGWRGDKDKNLPALHFVRTLFPDKKWYVLLDDDTYIFLENFAHFILQHGMDDKPVYAGKVFYIARCGGFGKDGRPENNASAPRGAFAHGGSGIVLNRIAMNAMFPRLRTCIMQYSSCWAGDMQVGLCMRDVGVNLYGFVNGRSTEKNFIPFSPRKAMADSRYTLRWQSAAEPITFHKMPQDELQALSDFERNLNVSQGVSYSSLLHSLLSKQVYPVVDRKKRQKYFTSVFIPEHDKHNG